MPHAVLEPARFSDAEFHRLVRSGALGDARMELRRGLLVRMNAQFAPHLRVKRLLADALKDALSRAGLGWIVDQEGTVAFGGGFQPMPDILVWDPAAGDPGDGPIPAAAVKLVVEVADSTLVDDLGEKLEDYAGGGLAEYWVADVKGRLVLQHAGPASDAYAQREPRRFGETWALLTRPDVVVNTSALLTSR